MRFSLAQLEAFYWTVRLGSVRAASRQLNLTQPALSLRIKELERMLGLDLFERSGRRLRLTVHGAAIRRHAEQLLAVANGIERYGRSAAATRTLLRIGSADLFAMTCLPKLLRVLEKAHPDLTVEATIAFSHPIAEMLENGLVDVAFLTNVEAQEHIATKLLSEIPVAWMAPPELALTDRLLRPQDLVDFQILTNPAPSHLYRSIHDWFAGADVWPERVSTCNTLSVIAQLAAEGIGITVLPTAMVQFDPWARHLRLLSVTPPLAPHRLYAAYQHEASSEVQEVIAEAETILAASTLFT